jgi:S1-C subfamily serine protease
MEASTTSGPSRTRTLAVLSVVILIVAASFVHYEATRPNASDSSASITSLQNAISSLQLTNQALQAEVAALSTQNNTSAGLSAAKIYALAQASVVTVQGDEVTTTNTFFGPVTSVSIVLGSGFVISYQNSYYIVTNFHVIDGVTNITATFSDGNSFPAKVVGSDAYSDLAILSTSAPSSELVPLSLAGSAERPTVGEPVYAIGNPFGLSGSMTFGIVSQTGRTITESTSSQISIPDVIQFSAPINPGNSGGPLLDSNGVVIGITTASATGSQGLFFAIPSSTIVRELPSLIGTGTYKLHPYLGISGADMDYQLALATKTNVTYGVLVEETAAGGPAASAGIRAGSSTVTIEGTDYIIGGDVIISVNGTKVLNQDGLFAYLEENAVAGQTVTLGVIRTGAPVSVNVVLGSLPGS